MKLFEVKNVGFKYRGQHVAYEGTDPRHPDEEMRRPRIEPNDTAIVTERKLKQLERDYPGAFKMVAEVKAEAIL